jgi:hypothetical protein
MVIFSDGFESGDFSAWTSQIVSGGTIVVSNVYAHHGTYSALCDALDGNYEYAVTEKIFGSTYAELYGRTVVYATSLRSGDAFIYVGLGFISPADGTIAEIIYHTGTSKWGINAYVNGAWTQYYEVGTSAFSLTTAYTLELHLKVHATTGILELWVDGVQKVSVSGLKTDNYGNIQSVDVGCSYVSGGAGANTFYCDCVVVADAYIGPEAAGVTVKKGSNLSARMTEMLNSKMLFSFCNRFPKLVPRRF